MSFRSLALCASAALAFSFAAHAQAPSGAPAGAHGVCNDGTYSMAASKSGACAGHKGVKSWFVAGAAAPASAAPAPAAVPAPSQSGGGSGPSATSRPAPAAASAPSAAATAAPARTQAAGGGNGQVWVNTSTKVYHCQGDRSYGTTKAGKYMSEADAKAGGARPAYGKVCSK